MFGYYHNLALESLSSLDLNVVQKGKEYLLKMLEMVPNDKITLYNLACAESILKNFEGAFKNLELAISAGYKDLGHLLSDKDFNNVKYTEEFTAIVRKLEASLFDEVKKEEVKKEEVKKEEVKVEEKKEEVKVEEKKVLDSFEEKAKQLVEMGFDLPVSILVEFLKQCEGNLEKVINMIYNV